MTENLRQRKRNEVSSNDDRPISIDPNDKSRVKSSSISTISLIFVATGLIGLCLFIQFALPHEDHLTKQFVRRKTKCFSLKFRLVFVFQLSRDFTNNGRWTFARQRFSFT